MISLLCDSIDRDAIVYTHDFDKVSHPKSFEGYIVDTMSVEGGGKIIKFFVLFFNFLFFVFGIVLIGVGGYAEAKFGSFSNLSNINYTSGARLLIAVGVIIALIAFFGCCGAWKENKCLLIIVGKTLEKEINGTIKDQYGKDKVKTEAIDLLQKIVCI
ncbi:hypothetical protein QZH41_005521 [Actinostola sp. cb2023]|nr:hypothetical protein QZH41_005521 [Actinostola sp. cb2023]